MEEKTTITQTKVQPTPALVKKIGKATYIVRIHFSQTSKETMSDKVIRLVRNDILNHR